MWNNFLGHFGDQTYAFWWSWWKHSYSLFQGGTPEFSPLLGAPFGSVVHNNYNELVTWLILKVLSKYLDPVFVYNLLLVTGFILCIYFTYKLSRIRFTRDISVFIVFCFMFSSYYFEKLSNHLSLAQVWVIPTYIYFLIEALDRQKQNTLSYVLVGVVLLFASLVSNYYGFFLILFTAATFFGILVANLKARLNSRFVLRNIFIILLVFSLGFLVFFFRYIKVSYLPASENNDSVYRVSRSIENVFVFSARPWFLILPSSKNPYFGGITTKIVQDLKARNYFLFDHYVPSEHVALFLGWAPTALFLLFLVKLGKILTNLSEPDKRYVWILLMFLVLAFMISTPPYFTIGGIKIFLPGYLIYEYVKVFRVTSRIGVVVYLAILQLGAFYLQAVSANFKPKMFKLLLVAIFLFNAVQMIIPINVTNVSEVPEVFTYIKTSTPKDSIVAVYPYSRANETLFWMKEYQRGLINPRDVYKSGYTSSEFTNSLLTADGLEQARKYGVDYLIYFKSAGDMPVELLNQNGATVEKEFTDNYLVRF